MLKNFRYFIFVVIFLHLNSCSDAKGEDSLGINYKLDHGDFIGVINQLEEKSILEVEENTALGAAYMGKAGLSFASLITILIPDEVERDTQNEDKSFSNFIKKLDEKTTSSAILDLQTAAEYYLKVLRGKECNSEFLSEFEQDICLYYGIVNISKAASVLTTITDDITAFDNEEIEGSDPKLSASSCAMLYAFKGRVQEECIVEEKEPIFFIESARSYTPLKVTVGQNRPFTYLMEVKENIKRIIVTKDYCNFQTFFSRTKDENLPDFYPCPIVETNSVEDITNLTTLVDVLNSGLDSVSFVNVNDEVTDKINEFRENIISDTTRKINENDILNYLEDNN